jgi:peptidoglycan/LPS O-acetylase OafA/YrhL
MSEEVRTEPALAGTAGTPEEPARVRLYDGLRGIAIVLVVLSHGWLVWPIDWIDDHAWVRPLFRNGNSGVTVFLVAGGFLMTRALTARRGLTAMRPDTALVRRVARVGPSLWLFLAVVVLVAAVDGSTDTWHADVGASVLHVVTYTWNWYVQDHLLDSVPDFGHLWYLSVDMQAFLFMAGVLYLLRRRPVGLLWTLGGLYLLFTWWRFHMEAGPEPLILVLLRTTVRIGPFVLGVLAASALPLLTRVRWQARVLSTISSLALLALVPLLFACDRDAEYLTWGGTALEWTVAVFFTAIALGGTSHLLDGVVGNRATVWLGRNSLLLYIWHYAIFRSVARHMPSPDWSWWVRTAVALALTVGVCLLADRILERYVRRWLRSPAWRGLDEGVPAYVKARLRDLWDRRFHRRPRTTGPVQ